MQPRTCVCNDTEVREYGLDALCDQCRSDYENYLDELAFRPATPMEVYANAA